MSHAEFLEATEGLSVQALEDQLYYWEHLEGISKHRAQALREVLRARYEREEVSYFFTDYGFIRGHEGSPNGRFKTDR